MSFAEFFREWHEYVCTVYIRLTDVNTNSAAGVILACVRARGGFEFVLNASWDSAPSELSKSELNNTNDIQVVVVFLKVPHFISILESDLILSPVSLTTGLV